MEDPAAKLIQQLGVMGSSPAASGTLPPSVSQTETVLRQSDKLDHWRILLVDLAYLLNASFRDVHYWEGVKTEKDTFRQFIKILQELNGMPDHNGTIGITFRGSTGGRISEKTDYVIRFGDIAVDAAAISGVIKRMGIRVKHLEGRLMKSFEEFSLQGIDRVFLRIPDSSNDALEKMRISLRIISCYRQAVENDTAIEYLKDGKRLSLVPIVNESNQPDPNLTQLAALNNLNPASMQALVQKVAALMKGPEFVKSGIQAINVYQTIFGIRSLKERLVRPPIELNSAIWDVAPKSRPAEMGADSGRGAGPQAGAFAGGNGTGGGDASSFPPADWDPALLKGKVAKFVRETYGDSPARAQQVMKTIFGQDYQQLNLTGLATRLRVVTDFLAATAKSVNGRTIKDAVIHQIRQGMDQIPEDVLDDLIVQDDVVKMWEGAEEKVLGKADSDLLRIIDASKERSAARKKIKVALGLDSHFTDQDYEDLATHFHISVRDAKEIISLVRGCFDTQGNFQRAIFEKNIAAFARHQKRIFAILWEFIREIPRRSDRLPFLNSLQLLVKEIQQPKQSIKVLLSDFIHNPAEVSFPDRNALMLAIQFLRTYNQEMNMDIEITPEEVLLVKAGLDQGVARYVGWKVDGEQRKFIEKIVTIRKKLLESFEDAGSDAQMFPIRFLLSLEREVHIFLALIGGSTAVAVIQAALGVYGNPASRIYSLKESRQHIAGLLQHLAVLIRALGRLGQKKDFALLDDIKKKKQGFMKLAEEPALVQRTLGAIDAAKNAIKARAQG